jgi:hypothetical protein
MKIIFEKFFVSPNQRVYQANIVYEVPDVKAADYVKRGLATPVVSAEPEKPETAILQATSVKKETR